MTRPSIVLALGMPPVVHKASCRSAGLAVPITPEDSGHLARGITALGIAPCKVCRPVKSLAWWEHQQRVGGRQS